MDISLLKKASHLEMLDKENIERLWKIDKTELEKIKAQNHNLTSEIDKLKVVNLAVADKNQYFIMHYRLIAKEQTELLAEKQKLVDEKQSLNKDVDTLKETNQNLQKKLNELDEKKQAGFLITPFVTIETLD